MESLEYFGNFLFIFGNGQLLMGFEGVQNLPLWHKNCFKHDAFEFLKYLILLKTASQKNSSSQKATREGGPSALERSLHTTLK